MPSLTQSEPRIADASEDTEIRSILLQMSNKAWALATTQVETKAGGAPILLVMVAILGFAVSFCAICVTIGFVSLDSKAQYDYGNGQPHAAALLASRLRSAGPTSTPMLKPWGGEQSFLAGGIPQLPSTAEKGVPAKGVPPISAAPPPPPPGAQRVTVMQPLEGGRLGLNLSEDDLVINSFGDQRATAFGFNVGDRIVQVNGYPVNRQEDFVRAMQEAVRQNTFYTLPIIVDLIRSGRFQSVDQEGSSDLNPGDICGTWSYGVGPQAVDYSYSISRVGGQLIFQQWLPSGDKVSGVLLPQGPNSPWIGSRLTKSDGTSFGEIRLHHDAEEQAMISQLKKNFDTKWSSELTAKRVKPSERQSQAVDIPPATEPQHLPVFSQSQVAFNSAAMQAMAAPPPPPTMAASQASFQSTFAQPDQTQASSAPSIPQTTLPSAPATSLPAASVGNLVGAIPHTQSESSVPAPTLPAFPAMASPQESYAASASMAAQTQ